MPRADDVMTANPITIPATATLEEATRVMIHLAMRHLLVVDDDGRLLGIVSDRDLRGPTRARTAPPAPSTPIADLMTRAVITASPDEDIHAIAKLMLARSIGAVPIVDRADHPIGIISYVDVLRRIVADRDPEDALDAMDRDEFVAHPAK